MDQVRDDFEEYVRELRSTKRAGALAGTDGEQALEDLEELIADYRRKLAELDQPSDGRQLLERFRREAQRL